MSNFLLKIPVCAAFPGVRRACGHSWNMWRHSTRRGEKKVPEIAIISLIWVLHKMIQ